MAITRKNPIWITLDGGDTFEGHQGHWADVFFSNATEQEILHAAGEDGALFGTMNGEKVKVEIAIREMTDDEVAKYPGILEFRDELIERYGEC